MSLTIRQATSNDAQLLFDLISELASYENEAKSVKVTVLDLAQQLALETPPFNCLIAQDEDKAIGFALYFYAYSTWEGRQTLYLEDLYVSPQARGTGAGAELMKTLAQIARDKNCARFEWSCLDWNELAINFYRRLGAAPLAGWTRYRIDPNHIIQSTPIDTRAK